jgi:hypothetical protein
VIRAAALACLALAACSGAASTPGLPTGFGAAEQGADASAAVAAARLCVVRTGGSSHDGFQVAFERGEAHRDESDGSQWIVVFPPGEYLGRLPPSGRGSTLLVAVETTANGRCSVVPAR